MDGTDGTDGTAGPVVTVVVECPDASAADVDTTVAGPLMKAFTGRAGTGRPEVESRAGKCTAVVTFQPDVALDAAVEAVREAAVAAMPACPEAVARH